MPKQQEEVNKIRTARLGDYIAIVSYSADGRALSTITLTIPQALQVARELERGARG